MIRRLSLFACALLLSACASKGLPTAQYDFGPVGNAPAATQTALPNIILTDVTGPAMLDTQLIYYRLNYADPMQARPYANSHWASTPLQMLTQRFKARFAQAGAKVLGVTEATAGGVLVKIEVDEFTQVFDSVSSNQAQLVLRASAFQGHKLLDQRSFRASAPGHSADAPGGVRALATASDALAADMITWLAALPAKKE